jgi:tripartite ATP-independent transporter DctM subunit
MMNELLITVLGFMVLLGLILARVPIAAAMALVGVGGTAYIAGWPAALAILRQGPFERASSYTLVVVPLFILMGYLAARAGLSQKLFYAANIWLGHRRGGLAMATVGACAGFAAICGSSVATGATMCSVALPEMRRYRYADSLSTGAIAAGGTLGILIPPSVIFVLYGIMTEQSIGKLLLAGIVPGIVLTILFILAIALVTAFNPTLGAAGPRASWGERLRVVKDVWEVLILFLIVIGGIYMGLATPAESAAFGAVGALLFGLGKRTLTWQGLLAALDETVRTTAMVFFIVIGADLFGYFMALSQTPMQLAAWLSGLHVAPVAVLWTIIVTYILLGALMDELAMILLTVPIFFPVVTAVGYDPIWFGVIIVVVVQIGLIAPPVGLNVFVIGGIARDVPMATIYRGILPFLAAQVILLVLLTLWPGIALLLPGTMK